ncbi:hypothetical protein PBV87_04205 [Niameybacter massiliensis]|uniref:Uncharacterized protein n=1 Tax=Holtiella tumoricola TaxID=3018743 RepID=A0AA42DKK7_9FIRM|nr:hypothetical protein [Holtiella tumoricola]MDA3730702.1 hypothetical protein [Holtiella tumoricola]
MYQVTIEESSILDKFFRRNKPFEEKIKNEIYENINRVIEEKAYKIKTVKGYKYEGKTIYEYKIPLNKTFACRVAYIFQEEKIIVFFMSLTIIKSEFTKLIVGVPGVSKV